MSILTMPRLGETVTEGKVIRWLKKEGETVAQDEMIVEISTDKVDTEIPSSFAGRLDKIMVAAGETCAVGTDLAVIETTGSETARTVGPGKKAPSAAEPEPSGREASADRPGGRPQSISPIVRKLARENDIDLSRVAGTGRGGRVSKKDVQALIGEKPIKPAAPVARETGPREEIVPISNMRRIIAERMVSSQRTAATVTAMIDVDMERIVELRRAHKDEVKKREGVPLTYLAFVCRAVVEALGSWPTLNASLQGDDLIIKKYVNLGIAVSVPGGLLVPVIKDAEDLNILGLARAISTLAARARAGSLGPDDIRGGSFTITNPGSFGSIMQTPIINPPEVAILSFDAIVRRPVVVGDAISIHHVVNLGLSYDHRVNDGAIAAQFLGEIKVSLESADYGDELLK